MFSHFDRILACDRQTEGRTSCNSIVRIIHMRHMVKTAINTGNKKQQLAICSWVGCMWER